MSESDLETEITFTIPSDTGFQSLKKTDMNAEEVESASDMPPFLQEFHNSLGRPRCVPANVSPVTISLCFPSFFFLILHSHHSSQLFPICLPRSGLGNLSVTISGPKTKPIQSQTWLLRASLDIICTLYQARPCLA